MPNTPIDRRLPVAHLVRAHSACAEVFRRHHIDFCCRGDTAIEDAARDRALDVDALLTELSAAIDARRGAPADAISALPTAALLTHLVDTHHAYLRSALPNVQALATKVARVHGDHDPRLRTLAATVDTLAHVLLPHLDDEEQHLFPALHAAAVDPAHRDPTLAPALASMRAEHDAVAALLLQIRTAADGFALPEWACNSFRTLFAELGHLEADTFTHVHLENHVLAPRFGATPLPMPLR